MVTVSSEFGVAAQCDVHGRAQNIPSQLARGILPTRNVIAP
jgi:hypothetical protein